MPLVEKPIRSAVKSISYRLAGSAATAFISFLIVGNAKAALSIGLIELLSKVGLFYLHERMWARINFGRVKVGPDYEI